MVSIEKGRVLLYRLFDVALEIDLGAIDRMAREDTKRLGLSKYPYTRSLEFANPPVSIDLQPFTRSFLGAQRKVNVLAKAFDFGVISIAFDMQIPPGTSFSDLEKAAKELEGDSSIEETARRYVVQLMETLGSAIIGPEVKKGFVEDYMIIYVEELGGGLTVAEFLSSYDPSRLLLYETRDLSGFTRSETLKNSFSYYPDDLIIVHVDNAFMIEPSGSFDLPDILEFANAQIFELRYYDNVIDNELKSIYGDLARKRRPSYLRLREYERLAKKMTRTVTDITEITERVNNSLKVTADVFYSRVYRAFMSLMRSKDWEESIREKLDIIMDSYKMLHDEIATWRAYLVEVGILLLIVMEIALALAGVMP